MSIVRVVEGGESRLKPEDCRGIIVGPGKNQPDPYPGYGGFVGWESPIRLRNGTWLVGFSAGYWHASAPTPLRYPPQQIEEYHKMGMPIDLEAPTGGRAMITRSSDEGKTWSKPETMIDTPADDRHPSFLELPEGTILCSFFTYQGGDYRNDPSLAHRVNVIRSFDGGNTWEQNPRRLPSPFLADETDGPFVRLKDGSVLIIVNGSPAEGGPERVGVFRSADRGETWELLSEVKSSHDLLEPSAVQLPDGRLVLVARPEGDICWSDDGGRTWIEPTTFGMRLYAPSLYVLRDGTLVCLHGSYAPGAPGFRAIFSTDGGETWIAPAPDHGFLVDHSYGYGKGMELPDGSVFITYLSTGGHGTADAQTNAVWCIRLKVRPDHSGIDLLPAPNR
ncbi:MAG: exo-alpha-sialidase [Armatimonadetes bacterium]|nr:exo-alpha-sialidase [Armatimonadota bacterium]